MVPGPAFTSRLQHNGRAILPGFVLCLLVSAAAVLLERAEESAAGRSWIEALVLAILLGTAVRTIWTPRAVFRPGIAFSAKPLLEFAVVLLGASLSFATLRDAGGPLLLGIAVVVTLALGASFLLCRVMGLPPRMAILVACGNSICGNSAIAAVAPVIGANGEDVASSIAFTAVLGVIVVLTLPLVAAGLDLSVTQYGVLSGLTVYAVPQVLAATAPAGLLAVQVGTLVKLVRVLMLGPVVIVLATLAGQLRPRSDNRPVSLSANKLVPWFIVGFLGFAMLRSAGVIPTAALPFVAATASALTVVAMAALGLGVDLRTVARAGPRVTAAVTASLLLLGLMSYGLIRLLHLP